MTKEEEIYEKAVEATERYLETGVVDAKDTPYVAVFQIILQEVFKKRQMEDEKWPDKINDSK